MPPAVQIIFLTILVPAGLAGVFALAASVVPPGRGRNALMALGLAVAWCAGVWLAVRVPRWPPVQASDWQFYAVVVAGAVVAVVPAAVAPWPYRWVAAWAAGFAFFQLLVPRIASGIFPGWPLLLGPAALSAVLLLSAAGIALNGRSLQAAWTFFGLMLFALMLSAAITLGGSASLGQAAGVFAASCGAVWLVSWMLRRQTNPAAAGWVAAVALGGLLAQSVAYAEMPPVGAALFCAAWPAAALACWVLRGISGTWRGAVAMMLVGGLTGVGVWLAAR